MTSQHVSALKTFLQKSIEMDDVFVGSDKENLLKRLQEEIKKIKEGKK